MKVSQKQFTPITITLETEKELSDLLEVLHRYYLKEDTSRRKQISTELGNMLRGLFRT